MSKIPKRYSQFMERFPNVGQAYQDLGLAASQAGPLVEKDRELIRLGIAVGAKMEGAVKSHVRRALESGASPEEIRHVAILSTTTIGFPSMMAALSWVDKVLEEAND